MNVENHSFQGADILSVREWSERGVPNGFLGAAIDGRGDRAGCDRLVQAYSGAETPVRRLKQIHSDCICDLTGSSPEPSEADGWFFSYRDHHAIFGIETADCAPVLISSRDKSFGAALHCGWRGATAGLLPHALELFARHGVKPQDLELAIGPCAGACCYEVGEDVASIVENKWCGAGLSRNSDKMYFDLRALLSEQALHLGLTKDQIARIEACTICNSQYFSYRRQFALAGRQLSFLCSV